MKLELSFISSIAFTTRAEKDLKSTVKPRLWNTIRSGNRVMTFFFFGDHHVHKRNKVNVRRSRIT